jgi:hypothetical protein
MELHQKVLNNDTYEIRKGSFIKQVIASLSSSLLSPLFA